MNTATSVRNTRRRMVLGYLPLNGQIEDYVIVRKKSNESMEKVLEEAIELAKAKRKESYDAEKKAAKIKYDQQRAQAKYQQPPKPVMVAAPVVLPLVVAPAPPPPKVIEAVTKRGKKVDYPDGTVWYRADRNMWIAQWHGRQEAARQTKEQAIAFLAKKYAVTATIRG